MTQKQEVYDVIHEGLSRGNYSSDCHVTIIFGATMSDNIPGFSIIIKIVFQHCWGVGDFYVTFWKLILKILSVLLRKGLSTNYEREACNC